MAGENLKDTQKPSGPIKLKNGWTIEVDRPACIGAGTCAAIAAQGFTLDDEAKAVILNSIDQEKSETILAAAKGCPVNAIIIKDAAGKKIYPK